MVNFLKFLFVAIAVAAVWTAATCGAMIVVVAVVNGTMKEVPTLETLEFWQTISVVCFPIALVLKFVNFLLWLRRSTAATERWQKALNNAYRYPRAAAARELSRAMQALDVEMSEQATWLATDTNVVNALLEGKWRDTRAALDYIDRASV